MPELSVAVGSVHVTIVGVDGTVTVCVSGQPVTTGGTVSTLAATGNISNGSMYQLLC